jgi:hypothetical protein
MATLKEKIRAEWAAREMLEGAGLPQPDAVEYGHTCIRLFWHDPKQVVIVQIDEPPPGWEFAEEMTPEERTRLLEERG